MQLHRLWLSDYRNYVTAEIDFAPGLTAFVGPNGQGKTNILEAIGFAATLRSFRGATSDQLVRSGSAAAILRAEASSGDRRLLVEAEIPTRGRLKAQLNRQRIARTSDLLDIVAVTVFTPDDLDIVKAGPGVRRSFLDDLAILVDSRNDAACRELERVLRQRSALLRQCNGRLDAQSELTLDIWDERLVTAGQHVDTMRCDLLTELLPGVQQAYGSLSRGGDEVGLQYDALWRGIGLADALKAARRTDLERGVTTIGPHRDDLVLWLNAMDARSTASQGEQRCLALALKLAGHRLATQRRGTAPVLLLDDVFSELDPNRSAALLVHLPPGQTVLTSAAALPPGTAPELLYRVEGGHVCAMVSP